MKTPLTVVMIASILASTAAMAAPDEAALKAKETAAWQAFKDKKADDFKKVVDHDMVGVYAEGIADMAQELADMQKWDMKSFAISDFKAHSDEKDIMVTSYKVTLVGTYDGKDAGGVFNAGSVWKQENGNWLAIFHSNVKADSAGAAAPAK